MDSIQTLETENDNVAPKIVGILPLSEACDTKYLRAQLADYCINYMESMQKPSKKNKKEMEAEIKYDRDS